MKKQSAMFWSFSALLAIGAMSPHVLWHADKISARSPSSVHQVDRFNENIINSLFEKKEEPKSEMDKLLDNIAEDTKEKELKAKEAELTPLKELVPMSVGSESREVKSVVVGECSKETQPKELEAEIKQLMEDKAKVINEIEELKESKKEKKKTAKADYNEDIIGIMSQLSSLMISQQQQSMVMMNQMFSMFQSQQPKQQPWYSPMSDYMSPYAFNASNFMFPKPSYDLMYPMNMGSGIGLTYDHELAYSVYNRQPAHAQTQNSALGLKTSYDFGPMFETGYIDNTDSFQPQILQARPHNGYDFRNGMDAMNMQKIQINK